MIINGSFSLSLSISLTAIPQPTEKTTFMVSKARFLQSEKEVVSLESDRKIRTMVARKSDQVTPMRFFALVAKVFIESLLCLLEKEQKVAVSSDLDDFNNT